MRFTHIKVPSVPLAEVVSSLARGGMMHKVLLAPQSAMKATPAPCYQSPSRRRQQHGDNIFVLLSPPSEGKGAQGGGGCFQGALQCLQYLACCRHPPPPCTNGGKIECSIGVGAMEEEVQGFAPGRGGSSNLAVDLLLLSERSCPLARARNQFKL